MDYLSFLCHWQTEDRFRRANQRGADYPGTSPDIACIGNLGCIGGLRTPHSRQTSKRNDRKELKKSSRLHDPDPPSLRPPRGFSAPKKPTRTKGVAQWRCWKSVSHCWMHGFHSHSNHLEVFVTSRGSCWTWTTGVLAGLPHVRRMDVVKKLGLAMIMDALINPTFPNGLSCSFSFSFFRTRANPLSLPTS